MKAIYHTRNGRLDFEIEGATVKDLFREVSQIAEVFDTETNCGACGSNFIRYLARKVEDFDFYELHCNKCHARLSFGQAKKGGGLFPKRRDDDGNPLPNRGWAKYEKQEAPANGGQKKHGVPAYKDWDAAQSSPHWGQDWLDVGGKLYKLNNETGSYREVPRPVR